MLWKSGNELSLPRKGRKKDKKGGGRQCWGSGMFIPDSGSRILIFTHPGSRSPDLGSRILDPKTATKDRGEKKLVVIPFYVDTNFTKW